MAGRKYDTPVALIERVSSPEQRVFLTTLDDLTSTVERHQIKPPALIIISKVIETCNRYSFESEIADITEKKYG
jgi:siroheme synthase